MMWIEAALSALKQVSIDSQTEHLDQISKTLHRITEQVERLATAVDKVRGRGSHCRRWGDD